MKSLSRAFALPLLLSLAGCPSKRPPPSPAAEAPPPPVRTEERSKELAVAKATTYLGIEAVAALAAQPKKPVCKYVMFSKVPLYVDPAHQLEESAINGAYLPILETTKDGYVKTIVPYDEEDTQKRYKVVYLKSVVLGDDWRLSQFVANPAEGCPADYLIYGERVPELCPLPKDFELDDGVWGLTQAAKKPYQAAEITVDDRNTQE